MTPLFAAPVAGADASVTTCTGLFTGTAQNLVIPGSPPQECDLQGAHITGDVTVENQSTLIANNSTIGHDLISSGAYKIVTGSAVFGDAPAGPVHIGNDLSMNFTGNVFYSDWIICQTTVGADMTLSQNFLVSGDIIIGDARPGDLPLVGCSRGDSIGRDLVVQYNTVPGAFGSGGEIDIGNNHIGRDLLVLGNLALSLEVADNTVGRNADCSGQDSPPPSKDGPEDGPNHVGRSDTCDP